MLTTFSRRVHTAYLEGGPSDYQYQDMGPMRFPEKIENAELNLTIPVNDMKLTFQLADVMNELNRGNGNFTVKFIPWIQTSPNGLSYYNGVRKPDGTVPTVTETQADSNLTAQLAVDPLVANATAQITEIACNPDNVPAVATNVFTAYKKFVTSGLGGLGGDDWSEFAYVHNYLKYSLNVTDQVVNGGPFGSAGGQSFWDTMFVFVNSAKKPC